MVADHLNGLSLVGLGGGFGDGADEPHAVGWARRRVRDVDKLADEPSKQLQQGEARAASSANVIEAAASSPRSDTDLKRAVGQSGARAARGETSGRAVSELMACAAQTAQGGDAGTYSSARRRPAGLEEEMLDVMSGLKRKGCWVLADRRADGRPSHGCAGPAGSRASFKCRAALAPGSGRLRPRVERHRRALACWRGSPLQTALCTEKSRRQMRSPAVAVGGTARRLLLRSAQLALTRRALT